MFLIRLRSSIVTGLSHVTQFQSNLICTVHERIASDSVKIPLAVIEASVNSSILTGFNVHNVYVALI
jgi:hypothetical protein